jgi:RNA polymerase-interacting CarD/CdnL/TRCF family regulator
MYTLFYEIIRSRPLREWLHWDYNNFQLAGDRSNIDRLFSWISEDEEFSEDDEDNNSVKKLEPVITRSSQIKELAKLVADEKALANLDMTRNLSEATLASEVLGKDKVKNAVSIIGQEVNTIFNMARHISDADRADIEELSQKIAAILETGKTQDVSAATRSLYIIDTPERHFTEITIQRYRRLKDLFLPDLSHINLFAGINNSGKTTVLEVIKLLASLNNPREFIDLIRLRAKLATKQTEMTWFIEQIVTGEFSGRFSGQDVSLSLDLEHSSVEDITYYLQTACFDVAFGDKKWSSQIHFFEKYPQRTEGEVISLCPSVLSSPFSSIDPELLKRCHTNSLKEGSKQKIIEFIRNSIDPGIQNIELDDRGRFTVVHDSISPNPDLTKFGEGLQRIFKIGLLFAGAKNGVVLIDEFENAIHAALLPKLVVLLHELSDQFNVQVFLTTHSKECIEAFATCDTLPKDNLSAYGLVEKNEQIHCAHFSGQRLAELLDTIDFDLRGGKTK